MILDSSSPSPLQRGQLVAGTKNNILPDMARAYRAEAKMDLTMGCPPFHPAPEFEINEDGLPVGPARPLNVLTSRLRAL